MTRETALVAGGSRGLGLLVAAELAERGFHVEVCARDAEELERGASMLADRGLRIGTTVCDVTSADEVDDWVAATADPERPTTVAIHVAGVIQVGPAEVAGVEVFDQCLDIMARGPVHLSLAVLPGMRERGHGRIGIVSSVGGVVSVPHLVPYSTAKFAAAGLGQGLHAELSGTGVTVSTILPPLMRTGSHLHAQFVGQPEKEFAWFGPSASAPVLTLAPEKAARRIVAGVLAGRPIVGLSWMTHLALRVHGLAPATTVRAAGLAGRLLPRAGRGQPPVAGRDARERTGGVVRLLTTVGDAIARRTNEDLPATTDPS